MRSFTVCGSESPGSKASVVRSSREGGEPIDEIVESGRSPLDSIVRDGARRMLQAALESEVDAFLEEHAVLLDECGRRRVVRNGYLPTREIATGAGILEVSQPRVRDKASIVDERIVFSSKILPPYLRKSRSMEDLGGGPHSLDRLGPWIRWSWGVGPRDPSQGSRAATNQFTVWVPFDVASF